MDIAAQKSYLRKDQRRIAASLTPEQRAAEQRAIHMVFFEWPVWQQARTVHCYISSLPDEVDTREVIRLLLDRGVRVQAPMVQSGDLRLAHYGITALDQLRTGAFGITEPDPARCMPADPAEAELIIVPGRAFDRAGNRLGSGKGYYDRFLAGMVAPKAAPAFRHQVVPAVPAEPHDVPVDFLITGGGIITTADYR